MKKSDDGLLTKPKIVT